MIDPNDPLDLERVDTVRQDATATLGVFFHPRIMDRVSDCIVGKVIDGVVGDGIVYRAVESQNRNGRTGRPSG